MQQLELFTPGKHQMILIKPTGQRAVLVRTLHAGKVLALLDGVEDNPNLMGCARWKWACSHRIVSPENFEMIEQ